MSCNQPKARSEYAQFQQAVPDVTRALNHIGMAVSKSPLEARLVDLVKIRVSQINGCAFCVNMHTVDAQAAGETAERLNLVCVWREVSVYADRERAALAWAEALTLVTEGHVPDEVYAEASAYFSEVELASLTGLVVLMNAYNRIGIAYRFTPDYVSKK